ncbi:hypothetical protein IJ843_02620 [bacterium]|nr:hypothetical protein [bacterium]
MSDNFSLTNLFKSGIDKEKFIQTHASMKASGATGSSSIFADGMENVTGNIFDTLDTNKNGVIDDNELDAFMSMGQSGNNSAIEEDDLSALYQKSIEEIFSKYGENLSPEAMFNSAEAASQSSGGMVSSDYIQNLEEDITSLNELINKTKTDSDAKVTKLQNEIDDYVQQSSDIDDETKAAHSEKTKELNRLQAEKTEYETKIARAQKEQKAEQNQITILQREIDKLDSEKDADAIAAKQKEIENTNNTIKTLSNDISGYQTKLSEITSSIESTQKSLEEIQSSLAEKDSTLKDKISKNKSDIQKEQESCETKVKQYESRLEALQQAKDYAYQHIEVGSYSGDGASTITNNPKSIEELESMGIKYSSEKGTKLAQNIKNNLKGFTGYCSRHVSNALSASGLGNERTASAYQMADQLAKNNNFKEIKVTSQQQLKSLPAGCVIVYAAGAARYNAKHGHIEVSLGDGTAGSDGQTRNMRFTDNMRVFVPVG